MQRLWSFLENHGLTASIVLLAFSVGDLAYTSILERVDAVNAWTASLGFLFYLVVVLLYVCLVFVRVARILTGREQASRGDLLFFFIVYLNAIIIFDFFYICLTVLMRGHPAPIFTMTRSGPIALDLLYFSVMTFTGVGFGDIVPLTLSARMLVSLEALAGHLYMVFGIGVVINSLMQRSGR